MKYIRFLTEDGSEHFGVPTDEKLSHAHELPGDPFETQLITKESTGKVLKVSKLLSPLRKTSVPSFYCIGLNYKKHWEELSAKKGIPFPLTPATFMKPRSSIANPGDAILLPSHINLVDPGVDYECELAIVIGKACRNATVKNAKDFIWGYTACNDVSARHWQSNAGGGQWIRGKSFDTFAPLGPALVTADSLDPSNLRIKTVLNKQVKQDAHTGDMIFTVEEIIAWLSTDTTLEPGTVIITGTPAGVGAPQGVWLKDGDTVEIHIEGIGALVNPVQKAPKERATVLEYVPDGGTALVSKL